MKLISFYSFKGGSGRTVCTANMIPLLAKNFGASKETPMLVMDMDLDSAGLTHILEQYSRFEHSEWVSTNFIIKGGSEIHIFNKKTEKVFFNNDYFNIDEATDKNEIIDFIVSNLREWGVPLNILKLFENINIRKSDLEGLRKKVDTSKTDAEQKDAILKEFSSINNVSKLLKKIDKLLPANGMVDISGEFEGFDEGSIRFIGLKQGVNDNIMAGYAQSKLLDLKRKCENEKFCAIIIDSASGTQPIANALHKMSDSIIIYCMRLTKQFREGTKLRLLEFISKAEESSLDIILLPVAIPSFNYIDAPNLKQLKTLAFNHINHVSDIINKETIIKNPNIRIHNDFVNFGIPEVESFKWEESILFNKSKKSTDQEEAFNTYLKVAEKIKNIS